MTSLIGFTNAHGYVRARRLRRDADPEQTVEELADILVYRCGANFRRARRLLGVGHWEVLDPAASVTPVRPGEPIAVAGVGEVHEQRAGRERTAAPAGAASTPALPRRANTACSAWPARRTSPASPELTARWRTSTPSSGSAPGTARPDAGG
ncbi:hypothetical protein KDK95_33230 [Actinospica sp. MGRD01-02]|uniref:Uncharacterized protein n=1 Tax=Actinospica acidithermotolerans TaxID=2828514 RepID=A0A941EIM1_9ACTN|nr:hypothetical protein [Actinospica acidithermotolerans]MBR7831217.1 hypothetical protein [Actinospica acidithermotolerans]